MFGKTLHKKCGAILKINNSRSKNSAGTFLRQNYLALLRKIQGKWQYWAFSDVNCGAILNMTILGRYGTNHVYGNYENDKMFNSLIWIAILYTVQCRFRNAQQSDHLKIKPFLNIFNINTKFWGILCSPH